MKPIQLFVLSVIGLLLSGCAGIHKVSVNSFNTSEATTLKKYFVLSGAKDITGADLQFQEAKKYLGRALGKKGFQEVSDSAEAEIVIFLSYGSGAPSTSTAAYSTPIFGQIGGGTTNVSSLVYTPSGIKTVTSTVAVQPTWGVTGYSSGAFSRMMFAQWLQVDAVDWCEYGKSKSVKNVWQTRLIVVGRKADLRLAIPVLLGVGSDYFGTNTGKYVEVSIHDGDPRIEGLTKP
jgi:hypothetical protein